MKTREEKSAIIEELTDKFRSSSFFYFTDSSTLSVGEVNELRGLCFEQGIEMQVVKNTLARIALESVSEESDNGYSEMIDHLNGPTTVMFTDTANAPARVIEKFRKDHDRPVMKAAYIEKSIYIGDEQVEELAKLKSREELLGDIVALLQSPLKKVVSGLQSSGGEQIAGLVKALSEREPAQQEEE